MNTKNQHPHALQDSAEALETAARFGVEYVNALPQRSVAPSSEALDGLVKFDTPMPDTPTALNETLGLLNDFGSPATTASAAGRFFGLVVGGSLPATLGARVLTSAWDQVVFNDATSAVGVKLEQVARRWLLDLLKLPAESSVGFTTGATMANFTCLAGARHALLSRRGWNVEKDGLWGAPRFKIYASEQIHVTVLKALSMLGIGTAEVIRLKCDDNGAIDADSLPDFEENSLILTQAGNVNSGAWDPVGEITARAQKAGCWVHVDGAFGLWAAASDEKAHLAEGLNRADSWVTDGHKWLNTPYDCGIAICKSPISVHSAMATQAPYLKVGGTAELKDMVPEFSRSARGVEVWAALHSLGRSGVADLVDRCCGHARALAEGLAEQGFEIVNDVVLNQVVATLPGLEDKMPELASLVQASGEAWFGPTVWKGRSAIRISVSSWVTDAEDIARTLRAIAEAKAKLSNGS